MRRTNNRQLTVLAALAVGLVASGIAYASAGVASAAPAPLRLGVAHFLGTVGHPQRPGGGASLLAYQGGAVQTAPRVFLDFWGSQWNNNDPSGEATILQNFFNGVGGSSWANTDTQYCEGVATGTTQCGAAGTHAGNQPGVLGGVWFDNASPAPTKPSDSQLAAEAVNAAGHFGYSANSQYVVATATDNNTKGFDTHKYCAYHSSASSSFGIVAWTNLPYITDAGVSCGANFNGLGPNAGITIVSGHEFAESVTDPFPASGWVDNSGAEIGDKCSFIPTGNQGAAADITLPTGTFPVQSLWSNAFNNNAGGCVLAYP